MQSPSNENIRNRNVNDIFLRNAILSVLDLLNNNIIIEMRRNDEIEKHEIPVFYNFASDEGFMKDFFIDIPKDCDYKYPKFADGNYDVIPYGILTLSNFQIKSSDITNKFVRGSFIEETRDINNQKQLKAFSARMMSLPLLLKFSLTFKSDTINKAFKIMERIFDMYYKNQVTYFQYRGIRIPGQILFPENEDFQKRNDFMYSDDKIININISLDMETYFPSFDDYSIFYKGNRIDQFYLRQKIEDLGITSNDYFIDKDFPKTE